jgi:uncharacterized protein YjbI with pentapeptide repeats
MAKAPPAAVRKRKAAPKAEPAPDPADPPVPFDAEGLKRVQDIIRNARATWFALLGALVFAAITLASVKDSAFFGVAVDTKLPVVGISVPVVSFFWAGALLIAAVYAYFHLYLELLWQALGDFPARSDKVPLADRIEPWIVADTALRARDWLRGAKDGERSSRTRAMAAISGAVSFGLVWVFGLAVIFWFWWRSMPKHDPILTLFLGAVLCAAAYVFCASLFSAWAHLKFENHVAQRPVYWTWTFPLVILAVLGATLVRTGKMPVFEQITVVGENPVADTAIFGRLCSWLPNKWRTHSQTRDTETHATAESNPSAEIGKEVRRSLACWQMSDLVAHILHPAPADLHEVIFTEKPKDWQGKEIAETEFRIRWCRERGEPKCTNPLAVANRVFPDKAQDDDFQEAWTERWKALLAQMPKPDLRGADLRGANLVNAEMEGADLRRVDLEGALLGGARLLGANLGFARLQGAGLGGADLQGADLRRARLQGADLEEARLQGADLSNARLQGAGLSGAELLGALLKGAELEGAYFGFARLQRAQLQGAKLHGASFWRADLRGADFQRSIMVRAGLQGTDLTGANLSHAVLREAIFAGSEEKLIRLSSEHKNADWSNAAFAFVEIAGLTEAEMRGFQSTFGDATVKLPPGFARPCQWGREDEGELDNAQFYGRWRGWLEAQGIATDDNRFEGHPAIPPPPSCLPNPRG